MDRLFMSMILCYTMFMNGSINNHNNHQEFRIERGNDAVVVFVHGILGSPSRFLPLAEELSGQGFDCIGLLLPGHGGSARKFSITAPDEWRSHVMSRVREAAERYRRVFLVGHSLGGLISLECAACGGIDGVVLINTPLAFKVSPKQVAFSMKIMLFPDGHDDPFLTAYRQDFSVADAKLYEYPLWLRQFFGLFLYIRQTRRRLKDVKTKVLILQSARDESVQQRSVRLLKEGLVNAKAEVMALRDSFHGYFPERDRQSLHEAVSRFVACL